MDSGNAYISELYQAGDRLLVGVLAALAAISLALAPLHGTWWEAVAIAIPTWGTCAWLARSQPGRLVTRSAIAAALMVMATLHIHQAHGQLESHFEIFVLLAFLLYYRDWQPVVVAAGTVAVLHLSFDLMQRGGLPVWVFAASGGLGIVLLHAAFVVFESALLAWMAIKLRGEITAMGGNPRVLASAAQELAGGNLEASIDTLGADEASLVCAMERMRTDLKATIARERIASEENSRIRTALDHIGMAALLADDMGCVVYANDAASQLLHRRAAQIRSTLPGFDPGRLLGTPLADLLGAASLSRPSLAALQADETTDIELGSAHFRIVASPVRNAAGTRLGTAVQCADRTEEIAVEVEIQQAVARAMDGDLTARLAEDGKSGFLRSVAAGMNSLVANLATVIEQVKDAAAEVHRGADELSRGNAHLSGRTEQQAQSLQQTASSMGAMATTVRQNADNVSTANQLAAAARDQAEAGGGVVNEAIHAMSDINEASRKIADIIGVIDELAFQTNLLALNAAVEAARAGEQGRGFAVVAAEVRTLAGRSAGAAREIKALIQDSVRKVEGGSELVSRSGVTLEKIVVAAKRVTDIVAELAAATQEQSSGIGLVSDSLSTLDELTQQNSALVEESAAASQSIADQARSLRESVASYHVGDALPRRRAAAA